MHETAHLERVPDVLERPERDDLLEEVESSITRRGVREVRNSRGSGPRDDTCEENTDQNGTLDTIEHEEDGKDTAKEDTEPHCGALKDMSGTEVGQVRKHVFRLASAQPDKVSLVTADDEETGGCWNNGKRRFLLVRKNPGKHVGK